MEKTLFVRDLKDKDKVSAPFLVKYSAVATGKTGKPYINLVLMDKSGEVEARVWDNVERYANQAVQDAFLWVEGKCQIFQGRRQVVIKDAQVIREDEVDPKDYLREVDLDIEGLYKELLAVVESMEDPYYRALAESILRDDEDVKQRLRRAPAAKSVHHAYHGGLLEHIVSVSKLLDMTCRHYGKLLDRDLVLLGGFLHDICKIWEMSYQRTTDYTNEGRLLGHLVMGIELVERKVQALDGESGRLPGPFPEEKKLLIKHVIASHHGELEYGSPKRPKCLEAIVVHMVDNLDSKVASLKEFMERDETAGQWTGLSRQYGRFFLKPEFMIRNIE